MAVAEADMDGVAAHRLDLRHDDVAEGGREAVLDPIAGTPRAAAAQSQALGGQRRGEAVAPFQA